MMPTLSGFQDIPPQKAERRCRLISQLASSAERYGFQPIETPTIEAEELLVGKYGAEADKLMYRFTDQGDRKVALRYDLTVPLQRYLNDHADTPLPFRRYQTGQVFRAESPQVARGRLREFTQFDLDIVGSSHPSGVAELLAYLIESLRSLGLVDLEIKLNSRRILDGLAEKIKVPAEKRLAVFRELDKIEKEGEAAVRTRLTKLIGKAANELLDAVVSEKDSADLLLRLERELEGTESGPKGILEIRQITSFLTAQEVPEDIILFEPSLARGLDYYTGAIFEASVLDVPALGSVAGGGVYDELFTLRGKTVEAAGFSFGIDRLTLALEELNLMPGGAVAPLILITLLEGAELAALELTSKLRQKQLRITLPPPSDDLGKQLRYADRLQCPVAIILGQPEMKSKKLKIRSLASGEQREVAIHSLDEIERTILSLLPEQTK